MSSYTNLWRIKETQIFKTVMKEEITIDSTDILKTNKVGRSYKGA